MDADVCIPLNSIVIEIEEEVSWRVGGGGDRAFGVIWRDFWGEWERDDDEVGFVGLPEA